MNPHNTQFTLENYLKALYSAASSTGEVSTTAIAEQLKVSLPTVNAMVKRMHEMGYVEYEKYKPMRITEKCRLEASQIVRKHRLTEMYLVKKMGIGWEAVHEIAEQIEHINSSLFFDRMDELLGFPEFDPHGSPIPDKSGNIRKIHYRLLSDCRPGEAVILKALKTSSEALLNYLNTKNISIGTKLIVEQYEHFDQSMWVSVDGSAPVHISGQATVLLCVE